MTKWESPHPIGVLAAAHAEAGNFEEAVRLLKEHMRLAEKYDAGAAFKHFIKLYESETPLRMKPATSSK